MNIKNINVNELNKLNIEDIYSIIYFFQKGFSTKDIKNLNTKKREKVLILVDFFKSLGIDYKNITSLKDIREFILNKIDNTYYKDFLQYGIACKIKDIFFQDYIYYDDITNLPNYNKLTEDINSYNSCVIFKLKGMSKINYIYGFEKGIKIVKYFVNQYKGVFMRQGFEMYKISGNTFALTTKKTYSQLKIRRFLENFKTVDIKSSIGNISLDLIFGVSCESSDILQTSLQALDRSINEQKYITYYSEYVKENIDESRAYIEMIKDIKKEPGKYVLPYYQGLQNNITGKIDKYEVLLRIDYNDKIHSPYPFLNYVENVCVEKAIFKTIFEKSIKENKKGYKLSFNFSESLLMDEDVYIYIKNIVNKNNINTSFISLEILETVISGENIEDILTAIKKYKQLGFKISIDDFGVGHSNLSRILQVDMDYLKIDGSLTKNINNNQKTYDLVEFLIELFHRNGVKIITEYVEDQNIQNTVKNLGVDYSQGYLFSKPSSKML